MDTKQVLEEEIHLDMSEHSIKQTEILDYTMKETRNVHRTLIFSVGEQTFEESSVQSELLQESAEVMLTPYNSTYNKGNYSK